MIKKYNKHKIIKKLVIGILGGCILCLGIFTFTNAQQGTWWEFWNEPIKILDTIKDKANKDNQYTIQDTALDNTVEHVGPSSHGGEYRLLATLEAVNTKINVYLQWITYVGLSIATILLIFNGFMMVTHAIHNSWDLSATKKNISKIIVGLVIMLGFWAIIKFILAVVNMLFWLKG